MADLTQRELQLLRQQQTNEKACAGKYREYAARADPALVPVFAVIAADEEKHRTMIDRLLSPSGGSGAGSPPVRNTAISGAEDARAADAAKTAVPVDSFGRQSGVIVPSPANPADANPAALFKKWKGGEAPYHGGAGTTIGLTSRRAPSVDPEYGESPRGAVNHQLTRSKSTNARQSSYSYHSKGPVSIPSLHMEVAEEWDGIDLSPWANLTSPAPLDADAAPPAESASVAAISYSGSGAVDVTRAGEHTHDLVPPRAVSPADSAASGIGTASILADAIMTERYLSEGYDAAIFESENPEVRRVFQEIQRDEQSHGERLQKELKRARRHETTELT